MAGHAERGELDCRIQGHDSERGLRPDDGNFHDVELALRVSDRLHGLAAIVGNTDNRTRRRQRVVVHLCDGSASERIPQRDGFFHLCSGVAYNTGTSFDSPRLRRYAIEEQ